MRLPHLLAALAVLLPHSLEAADPIGLAGSHRPNIVITATREAREADELPESVEALDQEEIENISPSHPAEALNRLAGVHINNLGGEGHMTAIRQPMTTGGVYLYLEDGLPTRPTGFFNHNALYEINLPQAERIEVTKGPGSALYGSDGIGGVINSVTAPAPLEPEARLNLELGSYGWKRALISGGAPITGLTDSGFRIDLNLTDNEGYRENSDYRRGSATLRFDARMNDDLTSKTIFSYSLINQSGVSELEATDYYTQPKRNLFQEDIGFREVEALRLSNEFAYEPDGINLFTLTPFIRHNVMELMPSWMVTYDPNIARTEFQSYGMLAKYRRRVPDWQVEWIAGTDFDYTPSRYREEDILVTKTGDVFTGHTETGVLNYDYDAAQTSISPYLQTEWNPLPDWRFSAGLRYDYFMVDYTNNLPVSLAGPYVRPASQEMSYDHFSPKLGLVHQLTENHNLYANYRHAFRVPSMGQLFRSASSTNTTDLQPVTADSYEIGSRGRWFNKVDYDLTLYHMVVQDDIVSVINGADRQVTNAGETEHQGIELALGAAITQEWSFHSAFTLTRQRYNDFSYIFSCFPPACIPPVAETRNFAGNDIGKAPGTLANVTLAYEPEWLPGVRLEGEWEHVGGYYTDETNTAEYSGHNLFNLRGGYEFRKGLKLYGRVINVTDRRYSAYTSNQVGDPDITYRPGLPRTFFVGVTSEF